MEKFITGNIVKIGSNIVIVIDSRTIKNKKEEYVVIDWVSFDSSNLRGSTRLDSYISDEMCWDCETNDSDYNDYECNTCKGTGYYKSNNPGMSEAILLANNCKSYIKKFEYPFFK